ncbi:MAG: SGNH/GDSL hydrolase family protein [Eubacteriaceae bacterium]|nr:SGNH/GDSL hydrolase family protein [Eubacteriaceae bacterium]
MSENVEGRLVAEYYDSAGGNEVMFLGDCEVYSNFSTVRLWVEYGITSYIRGSPQQLIWHSYYLLEDALRYETPKVVVFNVLAMKYGKPQNEAYNRLAIDGMRFSKSKIESAINSMTDEEELVTYIFPILRFHSRWSELCFEDLNIFGTQRLSHNGYVMRVDTKPAMNVPTPPPLADYSFEDKAWEYLDKMAELCISNGIEFVLVKSPSIHPAWYPEWDTQIKEYADKNGIMYVNTLEFQRETGIDYEKDTYDAGMHLNLSGAEKLSVWFGALLKEHFDLHDYRYSQEVAKVWHDKWAYYTWMKAVQEKILLDDGTLNRYY